MIKNITPKEIDGFKFRENDYGMAMLLSHSRLKESLEYIERYQIKGVELNYTFDYDRSEVDFLAECSSIEHFKIIGKEVDLSGLYNLTRLKSLELSLQNDQEIDFTRFPDLESSYLTWSKKKSSILECSQLIDLGLDKYKGENLEPLHKLPQLKSLGIGNSKLSSLEGISNLPLLEKLSFSYCNNLKELKGIGKMDRLNFLELHSLRNLESIEDVLEIPLRELRIEKCKSIIGFSMIASLSHLRKLVLNNVGSIESMGFLAGLTKLEELYFIEDTSILDGDLSPILELKLASLKKFSFKNRRHYTHKREELGWPECLKL